MCDVHLCDAAIERIFLAGPIGLIAAPAEITDHLFSCDQCAQKLIEKIALAISTPANELPA